MEMLSGQCKSLAKRQQPLSLFVLVRVVRVELQRRSRDLSQIPRAKSWTKKETHMKSNKPRILGATW